MEEQTLSSPSPGAGVTASQGKPACIHTPMHHMGTLPQGAQRSSCSFLHFSQLAPWVLQAGDNITVLCGVEMFCVKGPGLQDTELSA